MAGRSKAEVARRQELFIAAYAQTGDVRAAALAAGYSPTQAHVQGNKWLALPTVGNRARGARDAAVATQLSQFERQQEALKEAADGAITTLSEIARRAPVGEDGKPDKSYHAAGMARVAAAVAILDRAGHKPVERVQADVTTRALDEVDDVKARLILSEGLLALEGGATCPPEKIN